MTVLFNKNLSFLRKRAGKSQTALAVELNVKRTSLIGYEKGVQPPFKTILQIADHFNMSIDAMVRYDLSKLGEFELSRIEQGFDIDITGNKLRTLVSTVDSQGRENIEMVNHQAQAGYTTGFNDPQYIDSLPRFQMPFLASNKTYRCFQIQGDSMPPVDHGAWVTASYIADWSNIKNATPCIVVTKDDGIVFKLVYQQENQKLMLVSTNRNYEPYVTSLESVAEVWKFETYNGFDV